MPHPLLTVARFTLLEARRIRLLGLALVFVVAGLAFTQFLRQIAITESAAIQAALLAALLRFAAAFMIAGFVVTSMVREFNDKVTELVLARPLQRGSYYLGKFAGYAATACALAALFSLPLALFAPAPRVLLWGLSLAAELVLVAAFALLCVVSLAQVLSALAAVAGFYLLARSIGALQIMAAHPLDDSLQQGQQLVNAVIGALAYLLPGLDRMTQTSWLIYDRPAAGEFLLLLAQAAAYTLLLCAAGLFDLQRKNF